MVSLWTYWRSSTEAWIDEDPKFEEGPIKIIDPENVPREPRALHDGFDWVTMDLTDRKEVNFTSASGVWLLTFSRLKRCTNFFVDITLKTTMPLLDSDIQSRFSTGEKTRDLSTLLHDNVCRALKAPGWRKEWHVGVRASKSMKLVAFISAIPIALRVRSNVLKSTEINFLCVHKKLRSKRLAPVLIEEITRRCNAFGVYQAIYTAGIVLPKPVSSCRYLHRSLDWPKLYEVGFSPLPENSTKTRQVARNHVPSKTSTAGLRSMEQKDIDAVHDLLTRYLDKFDLAPQFSREDIIHWLIHDELLTTEKVIWTYVVEDRDTHKITDFFSFYCLESSVFGNQKYDRIRAAYLFYYGTATAFQSSEQALKERLNLLINDALVLAKKVCRPISHLVV